MTLEPFDLLYGEGVQEIFKWTHILEVALATT
jgi:hypothetical protein